MLKAHPSDVSTVNRGDSPRWRTAKISLWLALVCATPFGGCSLPRRNFEPPVEPNSLNDAQFLHYLATVPLVSVDEGARAVLMLVGDSTRWPAFEDRLAELDRRGGIRPAWKLEPEDMLDMGTLAMMLRSVVTMPGGANNALSSATGIGERRYALKSCMDAGVLPNSRPRGPVRGGELVAALAKVEALESK